MVSVFFRDDENIAISSRFCDIFKVLFGQVWGPFFVDKYTRFKQISPRGSRPNKFWIRLSLVDKVNKRPSPRR